MQHERGAWGQVAGHTSVGHHSQGEPYGARAQIPAHHVATGQGRLYGGGQEAPSSLLALNQSRKDLGSHCWLLSLKWEVLSGSGHALPCQEEGRRTHLRLGPGLPILGLCPCCSLPADPLPGLGQMSRPFQIFPREAGPLILWEQAPGKPESVFN